MVQVQAILGAVKLTTTVVLEPPGQTFSLDAVVNAASYSSGAVAPGEIVSLFGSGMGPAAGAAMPVQAGQFAFEVVPVL